MAFPSTVPFLDGATYLSLNRDPHVWLIEGLLPVGGLLNIYGPPKAGKTFAAMDLAMAVSDAQRQSFLCWPVQMHGPVWYLQIDTPRGLFQERCQRIVDAGYYMNGVHFADSLMVPYPFNITAEGGAFLRAAMAAADPKPCVIIIDTLRDAHGFDENDSGVMRNVLAAFRESCGGAAVVFLTHEKKLYEGAQVDLMTGSRGSSYLAGRVDVVMRVTKHEIRAEGRSMEEVILNNLERTPEGLWIQFDGNKEIARYMAMPFRSENARHEAFIAEWRHVSKTSADRWFKNFQARGDYKKSPPKGGKMDPSDLLHLVQ